MVTVLFCFFFKARRNADVQALLHVHRLEEGGAE
jgi:hypothetical protein